MRLNEDSDSEEGYRYLFAAIIRQAILDYQRYRDKIEVMEKEINRLGGTKAGKLSPKRRFIKLNAILFSTAQNYLFSPTALETQLRNYGLADALDISYIRRRANGEKLRDDERTIYGDEYGAIKESTL